MCPGLCPQMSRLPERKSSGTAVLHLVCLRFPPPVLGAGLRGSATESVVAGAGAGDGGPARLPRPSPAAAEPVRRPAGPQAGGALGRIGAGRGPGEPLQGEELDGGPGSSGAPRPCWSPVGAPSRHPMATERLITIPDPPLASVGFRLTWSPHSDIRTPHTSDLGLSVYPRRAHVPVGPCACTNMHVFLFPVHTQST